LLEQPALQPALCALSAVSPGLYTASQSHRKPGAAAQLTSIGSPTA
jgi:hypothetical protein